MNKSDRTAFLPVSKEDMAVRGIEQLDFVYISGDAYVDHPSFGTAIISRILEANGFTVGIIAQPNWRDPESVCTLGEPKLGFLVSAGNMDSMVNHYSVAKKRRRSDFFSPAMQQLCGIMKDNQVALPSDIGEGYFRYISPCPNIEMYICDVMFYRDTVLRSKCIRILFPSFSLFPTHWSGSLRAETKKRCWKREIAAYTAAVCLMRKISMRQGGDI